MRRLTGTGMVVMAFALGVALLAQPASLSAQTLKPEALVGKYEGSATVPDGSPISLKVELRLENGALVGAGESGQGPFSIVSATITGDKIAMNMDFGGTPGTMSGVLKGDKIEGTWALGEMSGAYTLTKAAAAASAEAAAKPAASGSDPISGQWDGITGMGDQTVGFTLVLKLEGDKVSGTISSDQGGGPISSGAWKDSALTVTFDVNGMAVTMVGAIKEGKLVGTLDLGGQMQMPWAAVKK